MPKNTQLSSSTIQDITDDYATITYCGELLNNAFDKFSFSTVTPNEHESVLFKIETNKIEELAKAIFNISKGFNNIEDDEIGMFDEDIHQFLYEIEKDKIKPVCDYYFQIFVEYLKEIKSSLKED